MKTISCSLIVLAVMSSGARAQNFGGQSLSSDQPAVLAADTVVYNADADRLVAEGDVELSQSGRRLLADRIEYDIPAKRVVASGNIVLVDAEGNAVFAETMDLQDDLRDGFMDQVGLLLADRSRIAAASGRRIDGNRTVLDKVVYSPCEICEDGSAPLWQIKADRVVHDQKDQTVAYRNAVFELFGVPIAYLPYFFHSDPTVDRKTGFLTPRIGTDTKLGFTMETPFFINMAPNRDLTVTPLFTSKEGVLLGAEFRNLSETGLTELGGSFTRTTDSKPDPDGHTQQAWRGHAEGSGRYAIDQDRLYGFDLAVASDDTYLQRYNFSSEDVLQNRAYYESFDGPGMFSMDAYAFQGLRDDDDQGLIPVAAPWIRYHVVGDRGPGGSFFFGDASALALTRTEGLDTRRVSGEVGWKLPYVGAYGDLVNITTSLRGDIYSTDGDPQNRASESGHDTVGRIVPSATIEWSWPLVGTSHGWSQVVEPIVSATWTGNNVNKRDIPNEDSRVFEFDETNLFEPDRFTGLDKVESGAKISYGLRFDAIGPSALRISGVVGQSLREGADKLFPDGSGLDQKLSDYVGRFDFRPGPNLDLTYRFRLAKDELTFRRNDLSVRFGPPRLRFNLQYLQLSEDLADTAINERKELVAGLRLQVVDSLAVGAQFRRDLTLERPVTNTFGLLFSNPCMSVLAGFEKNYTRNGELENETRISVRVTLRSLGDLGADSTLF